MKKIKLLIVIYLGVQILNAQTITPDFSTGYAYLSNIAVNSNNEIFVNGYYGGGQIFKLDDKGNKTLLVSNIVKTMHFSAFRFSF